MVRCMCMGYNADEPERRGRHLGVSFDECIWITGGQGNDSNQLDLPFHRIWVYDLATKKWTVNCVAGQSPSLRIGASAVAINKCMYMFGGMILSGLDGIVTNELWKLSKQGGGFEWQCLTTNSMPHEPAPRMEHAAWAYRDDMWVFGGAVRDSRGYLSNGEECVVHDDVTDQLLRYETLHGRWRCVDATGRPPNPRKRHAAAVLQNRAYVYSGSGMYRPNASQIELAEANNMFILDMDNCNWGTLNVDHNRPIRRELCSMTAMPDGKIVLHGGHNGAIDTYSDTWVFAHNEFKKFPYMNPQPRHGHLAFPGLNNDELVIIGGEFYEYKTIQMSRPLRTCSLVRHLDINDRTYKYLVWRLFDYIKSEYWLRFFIIATFMQWVLYGCLFAGFCKY